MRCCVLLFVLVVVGNICAADYPQSSTLTPQEIAAGWIDVFDGEDSFGWKTEGEATIKNGALRLGSPARSGTAETTGMFSEGSLVVIIKSATGLVKVRWRGREDEIGMGVLLVGERRMPGGTTIRVNCPPGVSAEIEAVMFRPKNLDPIFNGKDLTGWKQFTGNEKQSKSKFSVTPEGWLNVKNGPGDLQTERQWADFVFWGECISNGKALNSGVFFRCLPDQYQQGYEFQIHNGFKNNDRTKPSDFGTGAIYRRAPARKVVPNDREWFTMTLIAQGNHFSTWVNGYQTVDWIDTRPERDNARNGCKLGAGPISLQGHDKTTDLSFRNLRVAELKK